jgi:predicted CopG family antitoxin
MHTIEIDFDVFKKLTNMRETEHVTYNDVLRRVLGLKSGASADTILDRASGQEDARGSSGSWTTKGVTFPATTEFRATHRGKPISGRVEAGALVVNGKRYETPSAAAVAVTETSVNGWKFWECRLPGSSSWQLIASMRRS